MPIDNYRVENQFFVRPSSEIEKLELMLKHFNITLRGYKLLHTMSLLTRAGLRQKFSPEHFPQNLAQIGLQQVSSWPTITSALIHYTEAHTNT